MEKNRQEKVIFRGSDLAKRHSDSILLQLQEPGLNIEDEKEHIGPVLNTGANNSDLPSLAQ